VCVFVLIFYHLVLRSVNISLTVLFELNLCSLLRRGTTFHTHMEQHLYLIYLSFDGFKTKKIIIYIYIYIYIYMSIYAVTQNSLLRHTTTCFGPLPGSSSGRSAPRIKNVYNSKSQKNSDIYIYIYIFFILIVKPTRMNQIKIIGTSQVDINRFKNLKRKVLN
jgi:hypothetical protein